MRLFITTAAAALALAGAASAQTAPAAAKPPPQPTSGQYIAVSAGFSGASDYDYTLIPGYDLEADVDGALVGGLAWGSHLNNNWRVELGVTYRQQDVTSTVTGLTGAYEGKVKTFTLDANAYYDFPVAGPVKPYVGAGLGVAGVKFDDGALDDKGSGLVLRAIAGASYQISPTVALFAEGRYEHIGSMKVEAEYAGSTEKSTINMSNFGGMAGVRFGF